MIVSGFDFGSEKIFWARLDYCPEKMTAVVLSMGEIAVDGDHQRLAQELQAGPFLAPVDAVALEVPSAFAGSAFKFPHLIASAMLAGRVLGQYSRPPTYLIPAQGNGGWRPFLYNKQRVAKGEWDALTKALVTTRVQAKPTNKNMRDAIAVAFALSRALTEQALDRLGAMKELYTGHRATEKKVTAKNKARAAEKVSTKVLDSGEA